MKTIIIGGVAGGASAAARLRRLDEKAEIILLERGEYISYANCGLPYYIGGVITDKEDLTLQTPKSFHSRFNVDVRVLREAVAIDPAKKEVTIKNVTSGETTLESYDKLILSPGAEPVRPPIAGADNEKVFTLRTIPDTYKITDYIKSAKPKSAVVVGAGYIGIEMAENLHSAGVDVTIVEMLDHVIGPLDFDVAAEIHKHIVAKGATLLLSNGVKSIADANGRLTVQIADGEIVTDMVIMAVGVKPDSNLAKQAGLAVNERGCIVVDEHMRTNAPDIYAVGDAVEVTDFVSGTKAFIPLAGPANKQGRIAADNICGIESKYTGTQGTAILKCFDMTVAVTGMNERAAKAAGIDYEKSFTYSGSHASYYPGAVNMSIKLLYEKVTGKVLGAQLTGFDGVDKRCDVLATAIRAKMTVNDLTELELCYAPPFSSAKDPVNMAGFAAQNILTGKVDVFHWHDLDSLDLTKVTLLDVRTTAEVENGVIPGSTCIPLHELRTRMGELDKAKPVYVTCQIGLRGYVACRILTQNGFAAKNLSGGYRLYKAIFGKNNVQQKRMDAIVNSETQRITETKIELNACGLQCPGPIMKLYEGMKAAPDGAVVEITTTDPTFCTDVEGWCRRTGNTFIGSDCTKGISKTVVKKTSAEGSKCSTVAKNDNKNIIVFSQDLDKALAAFIIANAAASMGRKVQMFFTFWGLNILRRPKHVKVRKDIISKMFGMMMPRGTKKLPLSNMNMLGMGSAMMKSVMKNKNVSSLDALVQSALENGVEIIACSMSMDVMGIKAEELVDGIKFAGAAAMLANAEESDMSLFI